MTGEEWESRPGDLNVGQLAALSEKRLRPRKRRYPFGFGLPQVVNGGSRNMPARNRHTVSVARR